MKEKVHIVLATDRRCVLGCAVSMQSIIDSTDPTVPLHFHLFFNHDVGIVDRDMLVRTVRDGPRPAEISVGEFDPGPVRHLTRSKLITHTTYASCRLEALLPPDVQRCIKVDCDLVVRRDLSELWNTDLEGHTVGAVLNPDCAEHQRRLGLSEARYFNAGVLLVDLARWREREVGPRALEAAAKVGPHLILHDQDALNLSLQQDWLSLPAYWNSWVIVRGLRSADRAVFHYMGAPKPWHADYDRPFPELFFQHLDRTPVRGWRPWNPVGLGARFSRLSRRLPSVPGIIRVLRLWMTFARAGAPP
jgi:lipopolysaccharide biosynthesis glycosyltransferase